MATLDPEQRAAVEWDGGPLMVLAGPGSGKTRVITERIARKVKGGVLPHRVLCMTFTRRAAAEMATRVEASTGSLRRPPWIATFHSVALRILRAEADALEGLTSSFSIWGGATQARVVRKILKAQGIDVQLNPVSDVLSAIQSARLEAEDKAVRYAGSYGDVLRAYEEALAKSNAVDFTGLLLEALRLFREHPGARERWVERFDEVLVDEFQDTNELQLQLVEALTAGDGGLFVVGDPDQSIYAWRGASPEAMLGFEERFPGGRVMRLERNYRSSANILEAADALISCNDVRLQKRLVPTRESGESVLSMALKDPYHEARSIGTVIQNLVTDGQRYGEIAVLYRLHAQQRAIESVFARWKLPFRVVGGTTFLERREIQDVLSYLALIDNPRDEEAFWRAIAAPKRGVGPMSSKRLQGIVDEANAELPWRLKTSLVAAVQSKRVTGAFKGRARGGLEEFGELMGSLAPLSAEPAVVAIRAVVAALEPMGWIEGLAGPEGSGDRRGALEELVAAAEEFHGRYPDDGISGFLGDVALVTGGEVDGEGEGDGGGGDRAEVPEAVQLMTLHGAKGQEFRTVFVTGLEEEVIPHLRAAGEDGIEEERRLLFVGLTRAKDQLFLTRARNRPMYGAARPMRTSRFFHELPVELVEVLDPEHLDVLALQREGARGSGFKVGDRVEHRHYGVGEVVGFLGRELDARVLVLFEAFGVKELFLEHTSLRRR